MSHGPALGMKAVTEDMAASTVAAVMTDCSAPGILSQPL